MDLTDLKLGKTKKYVLIHTKTGLPLHVEGAYNGHDRYACGSHRFTLTESEHYPIFMVDTQEEAELAITFDTPYYNSECNRPGHGGISRDDMKVGLMEVEVKITTLDIKPPLSVEREIKETFDLPRKEALEMAPNAGEFKRYQLGLLKVEPKLALQLKSRVGEDFYWGSPYDKKRLLAVREITPDMRELCPVANLEVIVGVDL